MKTIKLIFSVILILAVIGFVGNPITFMQVYAQEKPTIEDIVGTWVNEEMEWDKVVIKSDGTWLWYRYTTTNLPITETLIIKDSWGDRNRNKYFKSHCIIWIKEEYGWRYFILMRLNESGTVLEWNFRYRDVIRSEEEDDVPEKYPTEINPDGPGLIYRIYYRQE